MKSLFYWIRNYWPFIFLIAVELILFTSNYTPDTFVVGWDNMYPEFNFWINIKRALFGVWQEYRGLGLEDGLSHAAQLPHYIFLWMMSYLLPQHMLRYMFIFLMHLLGGMGMYVLLHTSVFKHQKSLQNTLIALASALFYQFNFATVQMFYLPFEVFMVHFAFLPWLIWAIRHYLAGGTKNYLIIFSLLSLISTPQAHVPTVFLVYLMIVGFVLFMHVVLHRSKASVKRSLILILVLFCTNAYWGLPFAHNTLTHAYDIANSKNNQVASNDIFLKNQRYGDIENTALMRSFSLDYVQYDHTTKLQSFMFTPWKEHINTPIPALAGGIFFGLAVLGGLLILKSKRTDLYIFLLLFLFSFGIIGNDIPYVSIFSKVLRDHIPLFANVFRFVFTKFFTLYAFAYTVLVGYALLEIVHSTTHARRRDSIIVFLVFSLLLCWYTLPSLQGNFFYKNLRVAIPKDYTDTFQFFSTQPVNTRIAILPAPWFWAWTQYDWGVIGSGFQWFGIQQPTMDRAFDPWSKTNENFYWELSQSLYTKNVQQIQSVFSKYDISWILLDENIINGSDARALYIDQIREWLTSSTNVIKKFQSGKISVYALKTENNQQSFISLFTNPLNIGPATTWNDFDSAHYQYGNYITEQSKPFDIFYPFRSLFSGRSQQDVEFTVDKSDTSIQILGKKPNGESLYSLISQQDEATLSGQFPDITIDKTSDAIVYDSAQTKDLYQPPKSCDGYTVGTFAHTSNALENYERLSSTNSSNCITIDLPMLSHRDGYLVSIEHRPIEGKVLSFSLTNKDSRRSFIETVLTPKRQREAADSSFETAWITIPPLERYGLGFTLTVDNVSIGQQRSVNDLRSVRIYKIPYTMLTASHYKSLGSERQPSTDESIQSYHPNPAYYRVSLNANRESLNDENGFQVKYGMTSTLVLSQSFDEGWIAYTKKNFQFSIFNFQIPNSILNWLFETFPFVFGTEITEHVLVNNWANGWVLQPTPYSLPHNTIILFFWPQVLEWLGFLLLPIPFIVTLIRARNAAK